MNKVPETTLAVSSGIGIERLRQLRAELVQGPHFIREKGAFYYTKKGVEALETLLKKNVGPEPEAIGGAPGTSVTGCTLEPGTEGGIALPPDALPQHKKGWVVRLWPNPRLILCECEDGTRISVRIREGTQGMFVPRDNKSNRETMFIPIIVEPGQRLARLGCRTPPARGKIPRDFNWKEFLR